MSEHNCILLATAGPNYNKIREQTYFTCECGKNWELAMEFPGNFWLPSSEVPNKYRRNPAAKEKDE